MTLAIDQFAESAKSSAGYGSWTAPPRDLDSTSDSATEAGKGDWSALDWDTYPIPAGKDQKLSRGFGGGAPDDRGFAASGSSLLDSLTNNRNKEPKPEPSYYRRPVGRGKYCGRMSIAGTDPKTGRKVFRRVNCGSWTCSYCGPRKARTARAAIRSVAESLGLRYFLTLTLDPAKLENPKMAVPYMRAVFNKFRLYLKRKFEMPPAYICVLEFTQKGMPHLHVLFDRYIPQAWISHVWDSLGGGRICFIKQVTINNVTRYLSKYLTKDLLLSAPKGARRITTSRSIKLFPRFNSGIVWEFVRQSIWNCLAEQRMKGFTLQADLFRFISIEMDEETFLKSFELHNLLDPKERELSLCAA